MGCVSSVDESEIEGVEWKIVRHFEPNNKDPSIESNHTAITTKAITTPAQKQKRTRRKKSSVIIPTEIDELCQRLDSSVLRMIDKDTLLTSQDVYNMLNDGALQSYLSDPNNILLIDTRTLEAYNEEHVITSTHVTTVDDRDFEPPLRTFNTVIVYGTGIYDDAGLTEAIMYRELLTARGVCDVFFLVDSFKVFRTMYRFMCTEYHIQTAWERRALQIYPSVIIANRLYQGRGDQACSKLVVADLNITHIINLGSEHRCAFQHTVSYWMVRVEDDPSSDLLSHIEGTTDFIEKALSNDGCVLVHCNMGVSRSSMVTLAFLMKSRQWPLSIAYEYLKHCRSCISPNKGFLEQLSRYEQTLFGSRLTNIERF